MVRTIDYNTQLSLEEAERLYEEVNEEFKKIKAHYSGIFGRFKRNICERDNKTLVECVGVLLPLGIKDCVINQIGQTQKFEDTLFCKTGYLLVQIMKYGTTFKDTGFVRTR